MNTTTPNLPALLAGGSIGIMGAAIYYAWSVPQVGIAGGFRLFFTATLVGTAILFLISLIILLPALKVMAKKSNYFSETLLVLVLLLLWVAVLSSFVLGFAVSAGAVLSPILVGLYLIWRPAAFCIISTISLTWYLSSRRKLSYGIISLSLAASLIGLIWITIEFFS